MAPGVGAAGIMGIALETTSGTYEAPEKFIPFESESLMYQQATVWRRPIRNSPGVIGAVDGNVHTEGEVNMECLTDVLVYFLHAARVNITKDEDTPGVGFHTYTFTPSPVAIPERTLSLTIVRNEQVFAYTGVVVSQFVFTTDDGILKFNVSLLGRDEDTESAPTPVWPTSTPYGAGSYDLQIPTSTQIFDADTFTFTVDDSGEPQFRLKNTGRGAEFIKFGEQTVSMTIERDFENRTDYEAYKALTAQSITLSAVKTEDEEEVSILFPASIKDSYEVSLSGQGDLVRASVSYQAVIDSEGKQYEISVITDEDIDV